MARHSELYRRWTHRMGERGTFRAGERVGVAVSGGPDSILLLDFLAEFAPGAGLALAAVHFNHHLRGNESDEDERFVAERAKDLGVEFLRAEADVARAAAEAHVPRRFDEPPAEIPPQQDPPRTYSVA